VIKNKVGILQNNSNTDILCSQGERGILTIWQYCFVQSVGIEFQNEYFSCLNDRKANKNEYLFIKCLKNSEYDV